MAHNIFKGLGVALVTPFTTDGEVDYVALRDLVEYQLGAGIDFFCILCTTSETTCLTPAEKEKIKALVVEVCRGRVPIIMGCGGNNTRAVVEEFASADFLGIDGILSVCPFYNKPTQEGLYQHFRCISKAAPLPIVLYNVPGRTGVNMTADTTLRLSHDCENIVAIKEASGSMAQIEKILNLKPKRFDVLSGDDKLTLSMVEKGAAGVISVLANALPQQVRRLLDEAKEGNFEAASSIDDSLHELYSLLFVEGNPAGVKALLSEMGMIENCLRLPLTPVGDTTREMLSNELKNL